MKKTTDKSGFALAVTLVLMALLAVVVVAYLASTRIERSTSSVYANRIRAKITADSGLAAALRLLRDNTHYGNYITAMPAPSPAPSGRWTEVYRPIEPSPTPANYLPDSLRLDNAIGEILVSRADTNPLAAPTPQVDPRPSPTPMPSPPPSGSFGITQPTLNSSDSYDFNQIVRVGTNDAGRLVEPSPSPSPSPAFGQWVRVRNTAGELIGRYAFFIEDESMKVNVNFTGNNLGSPNSRPNDLILPPPSPSPATQVQELDPAGILAPPPGANRNTADTTITGLGAAGSRVPTRSTLGLLAEWKDTFPDYAHLATVLSSDDTTTARGWQRLDLNKLVADATDNAAKVAVAKKIANWIRDAWTGPTPLADLQDYQMFGDERLRLQLAANIVDYIDADKIPTDMGNFPAGDPNGYPVIGIEKIPYLVELDVVYTATGPTPDPGQATIGMNFRMNFFNLFETDLRLSEHIGLIRIKGVPVINKNGSVVFDHESQVFEVPVGGGAGAIPDAVVPWGGDNVASGVAGEKTFQTGQILSESVTYPPAGSPTQFEAGLIEVDVIGRNGERLDSTKIALRDLQAKYSNASPQPQPNDFLDARNQAASINATYEAVVGAGGSIATVSFGDPRYRAQVVTKRLYNVTRTDTTRFTTSNDKAELDSRAYSVDWYDYIGNRPLVFHRNGPMLSIGELGNISACEYPWRTIYLQYAGRSHNTNDTTIGPDVQERRGSSTAAQTNPALLPHDYVLLDLFKIAPENTRSGGLNINTQFNLKNNSSAIEQGAFTALFSTLPVGGGIPGSSATATLNAAAATTISGIAANRRSAIAPSTTGGPGPVGSPPPIYNNPRQPYFASGQFASDLSWQINQSENSTTSGNGRNRTTVNYSVLRSNPLTKTSWTRDYGSDMQVEEPFRKISDSITTRGNVFRVLYVGQTVKDILRNGVRNGQVDGPEEIVAEYLGEAFVAREAIFEPDPSNPDIMKTSNSNYKILASRVIME